MARYYRVLVIGGGIAGCSTLYHLTREGWEDVLLVERDELTSGTTWHSAAQVTNFGTNQTMIGLKSHSINLYKELSEDPEYPVGYHFGDGGIRLASTSDHMDGYAHFASMAKGMGVDFEVIDADECARRHPLISRNRLVGGLWDPLDGDIDPSQLCHALARRARRAGATILQNTEVEDIRRTRGGEWLVETNAGPFHCETVVIAAGYRVNEVAAMMGTALPVVSMEHQYLVTGPIPEIVEAGRRLPLLRCPTDDFYCRQEKMGLLVGFYEQDCRLWGMDGIDPAFTKQLCNDDLDRISDVMEGALSRLPALADAGISSVVNGPITYSADGLPLVGRIPGRPNAFCIAGLRAGLGEGGGHGRMLAQLISHGEAEFDTWCLDPSRFGPYANSQYSAAKAIEDYQNEFRFHMPHEHRSAGRCARCTAVTAELEKRNAALAPLNGWERAAFFKPNSDFEEQHSFRFSNAHQIVGDEVRNVRDNVGIMEVCGFARFEISGTKAAEWLDGLSCSRIPDGNGRVRLCYFLNKHGNLKSEATIARIGDRFWYLAAAAAEMHDFEWLSVFLPKDGSVRIENLTASRQAIVIAGPKSRKVLAAATRADVSPGSFKLLATKQIFLGSVPAQAYNLSYSGELAYELHVPSEMLLAAWRTLEQKGSKYGIGPFGTYAADSMRIEKSFKHWKADLITEYGPEESGIMRFVDDGKDFFGKEAMIRRAKNGIRRRLVTLEIDCDEGPAQPGDSVLLDDRVVGTVTSAAYGFRTNKNLALAFVDSEATGNSSGIGVEFLGKLNPAKVIPDSPYDPEGKRMRQ